VDIDARCREYDEKIKNAASVDQASRMVAAYLEDLKDSHIHFEPLRRHFQADYGFSM
jgi:hypothetical protein